jgi:hypothetical protein
MTGIAERICYLASNAFDVLKQVYLIILICNAPLEMSLRTPPSSQPNYRYSQLCETRLILGEVLLEYWG